MIKSKRTEKFYQNPRLYRVTFNKVVNSKITFNFFRITQEKQSLLSSNDWKIEL